MENFKQPYFSRSIQEFWSRWHISLSTWFRDYLYIPLGGNKKGFYRKCVNLLIVFLASGLWHGASMNFLIWGLFHGMLRVFSEVFKNIKACATSIFNIKTDTFYYKFCHVLLTFSLVCFSWIFFRSSNITSALYIVRKIFCDFRPWLIFTDSISTIGLDSANLIVLFFAIGLLILTDLYKYNKKSFSKLFDNMHIIPKYTMILLLLFTVLIFGIYGPGYNMSQFIYFQF